MMMMIFYGRKSSPVRVSSAAKAVEVPGRERGPRRGVVEVAAELADGLRPHRRPGDCHFAPGACQAAGVHIIQAARAHADAFAGGSHHKEQCNRTVC